MNEAKMHFNFSKNPLSYKAISALGSHYLPLQPKLTATNPRFYRLNGNVKKFGSFGGLGVSSLVSNGSVNRFDPKLLQIRLFNPQRTQNFSFRVLQRAKSDAREASVQNDDQDEQGNQKLKAADSVDAIFVLAGGQSGGGVPIWVQRRLDKAIDLQKTNGFLCKIVCIGGGTPHKPPLLSPEGFVVHESSSCAAYLRQKGAHFSHLIKEWSSYDTIGNGFFSLVQHAIPRRWRRLAIITSEFHMPRTRLIFEWVYGLEGAGVQFQHHKYAGLNGSVGRSGGRGFALSYYSVPDDCIDKKILQDRVAREQRSIENVKVLAQSIHTLEEFHEWFHTEHKAYNTRDQHLLGKQKEHDPALLSY
ncbi:hypothetical protein O6H91_03G104400 [Diphasiastrum complanatum]|uniref:Uncharacterized protein n=1 Tax=Diphasiastrum complanatum TaxID=34168 RepID=A0ACC2E9V5_DIPCM|nr:hypothetical protein O6H91_03G104400 [Diphasiastrum complanatum]